MKRAITGLVTFIILAFITTSIILYGRGYRFDPQKKAVLSTGSLVATSVPDGASVLIDDRFTTATNNTLPIAPGWYTVKITKEGYIPWQKRMRIDPEVVSKTDALLFPINPSLSPLTHGNVEHFAVSPDGTKIAFISRSEFVNANPTSQPTARNRIVTSTPSAFPKESITPSLPGIKEGIFILDLNDNLLTINRFPREILDFSLLPTNSQAQSPSLTWSPDSKQLLTIFWGNLPKKNPPGESISTHPLDVASETYLLDTNRNNIALKSITSDAKTILTNWQFEKDLKLHEQLLAFPKEIQKVATTSGKIIAISPDETKILYQGNKPETISKVLKTPLIGSNSTEEQRQIKTNTIYVYDLKEDKNYAIGEWTSPTQNLLIVSDKKTTIREVQTAFIREYPSLLPDLYYPFHWYPDSRHLLLINDGRIFIMDFDGINKVPIYAGPFTDGYVAIWPSGGRLAILTSLNPALGHSSLYSVNIR